MNREQPGFVDDSGLHNIRRTLISVLLTLGLFSSASHLLKGPFTTATWFQLIGVVVFAALALRYLVFANDTQRTPWIPLAVVLGLAISMFVVGGQPWIIGLAIGAGTCGRYSATPVPAVTSSLACAITGLVVGTAHDFGVGGTFSSVLIAPLAGFLAYSASRRADAMSMLRRTRADLARAAVAEERLRIARDLHDLLGHSLSLITLKAELAGRLVSSEPDRAAAEIAELELVARRSLSEVREAVAGFRQPDLAGELGAARQLLDAAGIASEISSTGIDALPQDVDATLAWAVREGTTNVVRHSRATQVAIRVSTREAAAVAEIRDNGPAGPDGVGRADRAPVLTTAQNGRLAGGRPTPHFAGSGLAGLAERVRSLGGELAAGAVEPQGFLLRVVVPLSLQA